MAEFVLTVRDIIERESFRSAKVIAGSKGLNRQVKWTHILEVQEIESLINGGELILTTGVGLQLDPQTQLKYVKRLIEKNASCICIERGTYFKEIPKELIELANEQDFPLIVFEEKVKFVDITQDLHTLIINRHHQTLSKLDTLSRKFIDLSLSHNGILKILQELNHYFNQGILFLTDDGKSYYYPSEIREFETEVRSYLGYDRDNTVQMIFTLKSQSFALTPVRGLGQVWGHLCMNINPTLFNDMYFLILDRAALSIAQILLRNKTLEERKQNLEDDFVQQLLKGRDFDKNDIQTYLPATSRNMHFRIFVIQLDFPDYNIGEDDWEELKLQRAILVRTLFKRQGFFPSVSSKKTEISVISSFIAADHLKERKDRFEQITDHIRQLNSHQFFEGSKCSFGISRVYNDVMHVKFGYSESQKVLKMQSSGITTSYFYEDLGVYRLLLQLQEKEQLEDYVDNYLNVVLEYDKKHNSDLYSTLCTLLECNGVKNEAADKLFIVRQTLYNRLEKLEQLLGADFMEPSKRLAIEVAIKGYNLINHRSNKSSKPILHT